MEGELAARRGSGTTTDTGVQGRDVNSTRERWDGVIGMYSQSFVRSKTHVQPVLHSSVQRELSPTRVPEYSDDGQE